MCSNCAGDYENPDATNEELEFSDYGRDGGRVAKVAVYTMCAAIVGVTWGLIIARVFPSVFRLVLFLAR